MDNLKKVLVFIPAFNEEGSISDAISKVHDLYPVDATEPKGYYIELLVVNDGSTDNTEEIVASLGVSVISHPKNIGLGAATRTAMEYAYETNAHIAVKLDADMQHDPADIEKVISPILRNEADICWGSRFAGKINYKMPIIRHIGNMFFTWLMRMLTDYPITDAQTGLMAYGRKYLAVFEFHGDYNPPQQILMDANYKHMRYAEVPVVFNARETGRSFVNLKYPMKVIPNIFRVIVFANPLKVFGTIGFLMILTSIFIVSAWIMLNMFGFRFLEIFSFLFISNLSLVLFMSGIQTFFFGILADLIVRKRK